MDIKYTMDRTTINYILSTIGKPENVPLKRSSWFKGRDQEWEDYSNSAEYIQEKNRQETNRQEKNRQEKIRKEKMKQEKRNNRPTITSSKICNASLKNQKCRRKGKCSFAHTAEEFFPNKCRFDSRCKFKTTTCYFIHSGETKLKMIKRLVDSQNYNKNHS